MGIGDSFSEATGTWYLTEGMPSGRRRVLREVAIAGLGMGVEGRAGQMARGGKGKPRPCGRGAEQKERVG